MKQILLVQCILNFNLGVSSKKKKKKNMFVLTITCSFGPKIEK